MNAIFQLLNPSNTVTVNRPLAHALGLAEAVVYGALISKYYYYSERGMLDDDGWFYSTVPDLEESTSLSEYQQKRCITALIKAGLIESKNKGMPAKRSFFITENIERLQQYIDQGEARMKEIKPAAAKSYDKKRNQQNSSADEAATENPHNTAVSPCSEVSLEQAPQYPESLLRSFSGASSEVTCPQHFNKTKYNKSNIIQSINQAENQADVIDEMDKNKKDFESSEQPRENSAQKREVYREIICENIECEALSEQNPADKEQLSELVEIMVEVVCSNRPTVRVNGEEMPQAIVKSRILKLNSSHIEYVLTTLKKNTSKISNIRSYLITTLYNAPQTIQNYWSAEVRHDLG